MSETEPPGAVIAGQPQSARGLYAHHAGDAVPLSFARSLAGELYSSVVSDAVSKRQDAEALGLREEQADAALFLAKLPAFEGKEIVALLRDHLKPPSFSRTPSELASAQQSALVNLRQKFGVIDTPPLVAAAQAAQKHLTKSVPGFNRLFRQGLGSDSKSIEALAGLARRRGWAK